MRLRVFALFAVVCSLVLPATSQSVIYVDSSATGLNDGTSWTNGFSVLQDALDSATAGDHVWVATGTYRPDKGFTETAGDRSATFTISDSIGVFGGFDGSETALSERNLAANITVLSGDLLNNDSGERDANNQTLTDNSFSVVTIAGPAVIDGVHIVGGNSSSQSDDRIGAAITANAPVELHGIHVYENVAKRGGAVKTFSALEVYDSEFSANNAYGGGRGAGIVTAGPSLIIERVLFLNNKATDGGAVYAKVDGLARFEDVRFESNEAEVAGALFIDGASADVVIANSRFSKNVATYGHAIEIDAGQLTVYNTVFDDNRSSARQFDLTGATVVSWLGTTNLINNTFWSSTAPHGGFVASFDSTIFVANSILWSADGGASVANFGGQIEVGSSITSGSVPNFVDDLGGNAVVDPLFADPDGPDNIPGNSDDNFRLSDLSPAIDHGNNLFLPIDQLDLDSDGDVAETLPVDFARGPRIRDGGTGAHVVDAGAIEFDEFPSGIESERQDFELAVFPNPASKQVTVRGPFDPATEAQVVVRDLLGRTVLRFNGVATNSRASFDIRALPQGVYFGQILHRGLISRFTFSVLR